MRSQKPELPQPLLSPSCLRQLWGIPVRQSKRASEQACSPLTVQACSTHLQLPHTMLFSGHSLSLGWYWSKEGCTDQVTRKYSSTEKQLCPQKAYSWRPAQSLLSHPGFNHLPCLWIFISVSIKPYWAKWLHNLSQYNYAWHTEERFRDT